MIAGFDEEQFNADLTAVYSYANDLFHVDIAKTQTLYHYSNIHGLMGIMNSRSFRSTNIQFLNDSKEYQYAREQIATGIDFSLEKWKGMPLRDGYTRQVNEIISAGAIQLEKSLRS